MSAIESVIADVESKIAQLQALITGLRKFASDPIPAAPVASPKPVKKAVQKYTRRATKISADKPAAVKSTPATPPLSSEGRPTSLGKAMKLIASRLREFSQEQLRSALDAEFSDLLEAAGESTFYGNLAYWVKTQKLNKTGDGREASYTVIDREWFA